MGERPIIFSGPMVRALLAGRKTQTRRLIFLARPARDVRFTHISVRDGRQIWTASSDDGARNVGCPYGQPGDRLWVRETWRTHWNAAHVSGIRYAADGAFAAIENTLEAADRWMEARRPGHAHPWRSPIFLPRWASRLTLELADLRAERLQEISELDACAEGAGFDEERAAHLPDHPNLQYPCPACSGNPGDPDVHPSARRPGVRVRETWGRHQRTSAHCGLITPGLVPVFPVVAAPLVAAHSSSRWAHDRDLANCFSLDACCWDRVRSSRPSAIKEIRNASGSRACGCAG